MTRPLPTPEKLATTIYNAYALMGRALVAATAADERDDEVIAHIRSARRELNSAWKTAANNGDPDLDHTPRTAAAEAWMYLSEVDDGNDWEWLELAVIHQTPDPLTASEQLYRALYNLAAMAAGFAKFMQDESKRPDALAWSPEDFPWLNDQLDNIDGTHDELSRATAILRGFMQAGAKPGSARPSLALVWDAKLQKPPGLRPQLDQDPESEG